MKFTGWLTLFLLGAARTGFWPARPWSSRPATSSTAVARSKAANSRQTWHNLSNERTPVMTDATLAPAEVPDNAAELHAGFPRWERLSTEGALQPCDGHAAKGVSALVIMLLASGRSVVLCGHCARKAGWEHTRTAQRENRQKGSAH